MTISFYPGPSRVHDRIPAYVKDAFRQGILSINHRSDTFMEISERTIRLLKENLDIPSDYTVFYTSSATECWEIIAQSVVTSASHHIYNGSFGEKWFDYTKRICANAEAHPFSMEEVLSAGAYHFADNNGVICITQNETSNGTQVNVQTIGTIRRNHPNHLVAVDATSSMAGIHLDFRAADIWFASVQKCFGLPAGLGLMICSPRAIDRIKEIGERNHYNSLTFMNDMMQKWQTPFTPNVLNIYLLMRVMTDSKPISQVHRTIKRRYARWMSFLESRASIRHLVANKEVHSWTVLPIAAEPEMVARIKAEAKSKGFLLGEGYGKFKESTFRIANFPAIRNIEIRKLQEMLKAF